MAVQGAFGYEEDRTDQFRGFNPAFVRKVWAKRRAYEAPKRARRYLKWTPKEVDTISEMLRDGKPLTAIAERLGKTYHSVKAVVRNHPELMAKMDEGTAAARKRPVDDLVAPEWVRQVLRDVADGHKIHPAALLEDVRVKAVVRARNELFYRLRTDERSPSYEQIAIWFGREHSAVIYSVSAHAHDNNLPLEGGMDIARRREAARNRFVGRAA